MELTKLTEDLDKKKYWQEHVASWRVSNLSQAEYCRINGLRTYVFSYWKRKESKAEEVPLRFFLWLPQTTGRYQDVHPHCS